LPTPLPHVPHLLTTTGHAFVADAELAPLAETVSRIVSVKELFPANPHPTAHEAV
jgi:hypothetical protein